MNILRIFSKGNVAISPHKISVAYVVDDYRGQRVRDIPNFAKLLTMCTGFSIHIIKGKSIYLEFSGDFPVQKTHLYTAAEQPLTLDDLNRIVDEAPIQDTSRGERFLEFFKDVDIENDDDDSFIAAYRSALDATLEKPIVPISISSTQRWNKMRRIRSRLASIMPAFEIISDKPDGSFRGGTTVYLRSRRDDDTIRFTEEQKNLLRDMLNISEEFVIYTSIEDGVCRLEFTI